MDGLGLGLGISFILDWLKNGPAAYAIGGGRGLAFSVDG